MPEKLPDRRPDRDPGLLIRLNPPRVMLLAQDADDELAVRDLADAVAALLKLLPAREAA